MKRLDGASLEVARHARREKEAERILELHLSAKTTGPEARKHLMPLLKHYAKKPHPFKSCVRDNRERFGPGTEAVCATLKDLIRGDTHWRGHPERDKGAAGLTGLSDDGIRPPSWTQEDEDAAMEALDALSEAEVLEIVDALAPQELSLASTPPGPWPGNFMHDRTTYETIDATDMPAQDDGQSPPNLRHASVDAGGRASSCADCEHFNGATLCNLYDYETRVDLICDSYNTPDNPSKTEAFMVGLSREESCRAELFLSDSTTEVADGLIWKEALREGEFVEKLLPDSSQRMRMAKMRVVDGHSPDPSSGIGLDDIIDAHEQNLYDHVTVPTSHDDKPHENTGFVERLVKTIRPDGRKTLMAGVRFTKDAIKESVLDGSIANVSAGLRFFQRDHDTGATYPTSMAHLALTNKPFVAKMSPSWSSEVPTVSLSLSDDRKSMKVDEEQMQLKLSRGEIKGYTRRLKNGTVVHVKPHSRLFKDFADLDEVSDAKLQKHADDPTDVDVDFAIEGKDGTPESHDTDAFYDERAEFDPHANDPTWKRKPKKRLDDPADIDVDFASEGKTASKSILDQVTRDHGYLNDEFDVPGVGPVRITGRTDTDATIDLRPEEGAYVTVHTPRLAFGMHSNVERARVSHSSSDSRYEKNDANRTKKLLEFANDLAAELDEKLEGQVKSQWQERSKKYAEQGMTLNGSSSYPPKPSEPNAEIASKVMSQKQGEYFDFSTKVGDHKVIVNGTYGENGSVKFLVPGEINVSVYPPSIAWGGVTNDDIVVDPARVTHSSSSDASITPALLGEAQRIADSMNEKFTESVRESFIESKREAEAARERWQQAQEKAKLPARVTNQWLSQIVPTLSEEELKYLRNNLRKRNWSDKDLEERVDPLLKSE